MISTDAFSSISKEKPDGLATVGRGCLSPLRFFSPAPKLCGKRENSNVGEPTSAYENSSEDSSTVERVLP